jgi:hypothetical protein
MDVSIQLHSSIVPGTLWIWGFVDLISGLYIVESDEANFYIYLIFPAALGLGVYSASNRNEHQKQKNNVSEE